MPITIHTLKMARPLGNWGCGQDKPGYVHMRSHL